jgi:hypothetical protein
VIERVGRGERVKKVPYRLGDVSGAEHAADGAPVEHVGCEELDRVHDQHRLRDAIHQSTGMRIERTRSPGTYISGSRVRSTRVTSHLVEVLERDHDAVGCGLQPDRGARDDGRLGVDGRLAGGARAEHGVLVDRPIGVVVQTPRRCERFGQRGDVSPAAASGDVGQTPLRRAGRSASNRGLHDTEAGVTVSDPRTVPPPQTREGHPRACRQGAQLIRERRRLCWSGGSCMTDQGACRMPGRARRFP